MQTAKITKVVARKIAGPIFSKIQITFLLKLILTQLLKECPEEEKIQDKLHSLQELKENIR